MREVGGDILVGVSSQVNAGCCESMCMREREKNKKREVRETGRGNGEGRAAVRTLDGVAWEAVCVPDKGEDGLVVKAVQPNSDSDQLITPCHLAFRTKATQQGPTLEWDK
jgi:hypothetical protein